jgi:hypothetical protein
MFIHDFGSVCRGGAVMLLAGAKGDALISR